MSIDSPAHDQAHSHGEGHHDSPEKVDGRERLGVWLFIGADIVTVGALLFTYLYLRGVNTSGHWMSMWGYKGSLHTYAYWFNAAANGTLKSPTLIHVGTVSAGLQWLIAAITVVSAAVLWAGEKGLRSNKNAKSFSATALVAVILSIVGIIFAAVLLKDLPQIFVSVNDSNTMSYTTYDSAMMALLGSTIFHLVVLAFLGLGLSIRASRGVVSGDRWYQVRLVRFFWVWVAISSVVATLITTTITSTH
jgi:heme/copper-type cytochrome/quinol oxidase subunit 3